MTRILCVLPIGKQADATTAARATFAKNLPAKVDEIFPARYSSTGREPATHLVSSGFVSDLDLLDFKTAAALDVTTEIWDAESDPTFARRTLTEAGLFPVIPEDLATP